MLGDAGWRAYSVDLRGHGESDWAADGDYTLDALSPEDVARCADWTARPALVGASLGGLSALAAIGGNPPQRLATSLVLVDVAPRIEEAGRDRIAQFMMEHIENGFASLEEVADAIACLQPAPASAWATWSGLRKNLRQRDGRWYWHWDPAFIRGGLGSPDETRTTIIDATQLEGAARRVTVPVLVVRGLVSDLLSEEGARQLLDLVPHGEMVSVAGAGHMVAGDRNDLFNDAIVSFLSRPPV